MDTPIMNVKECAAYLHISSSTVYRMLNARTLPAFRVGSDWRFRAEQIDQWMREQTEAWRIQRRS